MQQDERWLFVYSFIKNQLLQLDVSSVHLGCAFDVANYARPYRKADVAAPFLILAPLNNPSQFFRQLSMDPISFISC